jgi:Cu-Zn family superoxide dismutase
MGNWYVDSQGTINQTKLLDLISLSSNFSVIGRAIVVHNQTDDCLTANGARIAHGVIGIGNPNLFLNNQVLIKNDASNQYSGITKASCVLRGTQGNEQISGVVYFEEKIGTTVTARITGLSKNTVHGIHIHMYGDLSLPDGTASQGHFNPFNNPHALPLTPNRHIGDMGNLNFYDENGVGWYNWKNDNISLSGSASIIGRTVILHQMRDDGCTQPTGNAGSRLAQCVIGLSPNVQIPQLPNGCCQSQQASNCSPNAGSSSLKDNSTWKIVVIVFAIILAIVGIAVGIFIWRKRQPNHSAYRQLF